MGWWWLVLLGVHMRKRGVMKVLLLLLGLLHGRAALVVHGIWRALRCVHRRAQTAFRLLRRAEPSR